MRMATLGLSEEQARAVADMLTAVETATAATSDAGKEKARERWRKWKERLALSASDWAALRAAVLERDNFTCVYCGAKGTALSPLHVDHITPLIQGGTNDMNNLATACRECNCGKSGKTVQEWSR